MIIIRFLARIVTFIKETLLNIIRDDLQRMGDSFSIQNFYCSCGTNDNKDWNLIDQPGDLFERTTGKNSKRESILERIMIPVIHREHMNHVRKWGQKIKDVMAITRFSSIFNYHKAHGRHKSRRL